MRKRNKVILGIIGSAVVLIVLVYGILWKVWVSPELPEPKSDVPTTYKIGWWAYQNNIEITNLDVKTIYEKLNLFNNKALIEYVIEGTVYNNKGWEPYIEKAHISERWISDSENGTPIGDIVITPVIAVKENKTYQGETISFSVKVQDYLSTTNWGNNKYKIKSGAREKALELSQRK